MFSKSCKYGIRAVIYLANNTDDSKKIGTTILAKAIHVPNHFLAKILQDLSRKNLISSTKGPNGGFYLTKENKRNKLLDIVNSIDGLSSFQNCSLGLDKCDDEHPCPIHHVILPFRNSLLKELTDKTIAEFAAELDKGTFHLSN